MSTPGSFSKSVFPGLRLGYLVGPASFIREARALRLMMLRHPPGHIQRTVAYFLSLVPSWLRVAVEFRHPSWHHEGTFALLERHGAGYCVMSGAGLPCVLRATAPFVYMRFHGPDRGHLYAGSYGDADLGWWAARIGEWRGGTREGGSGRDVFAYFNNDGGGNAVRDALRLRGMVGE